MKIKLTEKLKEQKSKADVAVVDRRVAWAQRQKEAGNCIRCGKTAINLNFCEFHNEQAKKYRKEAYRRSKMYA